MRNKPKQEGSDMADRTAVATKQQTSSSTLKPVRPSDLLNQMQQLYDSIARRAFEIFENNGRNFGRDVENWLQAESELLHPVPIDVSKCGEDLRVRAEVPGFTVRDLEVSVEPHRVMIVGKREAKEEANETKTIYTERPSDQVLRVVDLPEAIDPEKVSASLKDGVLELTMPKAAPPRRVKIEPKAASAK
jgi:HSP20 family protein